jgi:SAM-dependent methyltransferase
MTDYQQTLASAILDPERFVSATFSGQQRGQTMRWTRLNIRPVMLKNGRHLQFAYFDGQHDITKNYTGDEAAQRVHEALDLPFKHYHVLSTDEDFQVRITKKGKALMNRQVAQRDLPSLSHDREKDTMISAGADDDYLRRVGLLTKDGKIKAGMHAKFRQINEFLRLLVDSGALELAVGHPLEVVDMGCGNAYLTFAVYHYLNHLRGVPAQVTGVDLKADLMTRHNRNAADLGWTGLRFETRSIADYEPEITPDIVIALHACDTASDDAIAQGVRWGSPVIFAAPCCHHDLQAQLDQQPAPEPFSAVMRYGILQERVGDVLTDSFRALILRLMGYRTDLVEFVDTEHTPKNILIRALKTAQPGEARFVSEYQDLKRFWSVTPHLETLLADEIAPLLADVT